MTAKLARLAKIRILLLVVCANLWLYSAMGSEERDHRHTTQPQSASTIAPTRFNLADLTWRRLSLRTPTISAPVKAEVEIDVLDEKNLQSQLVHTNSAAPTVIDNDSTPLLIKFTSVAAGHNLTNELWFDAQDGAALQRVRIDAGRGDERFRVYRFTNEGVFRIRKKPKPGEENLPAEQWSDVSETFNGFSFPPSPNVAVSESSALFYLASVGLTKPGEELEIVTYFDDDLHVINLKADGVEKINTDFQTHANSGKEKIAETRDALRISVSSRPFGNTKRESRLNIAGLKDDIQIYVDQELKLPLELRGKTGFFSTARLILKDAVLR